MKTVIRIILFAAFIVINIYAQQKTFRDSLLDKMTGDWILKSTIAEQETTHNVKAAWVFGHQYIQIHEVSGKKDAEGNPAYEAIVYVGWDETAKQYTCLWLDVTGSSGLNGQAIAHADS